MRVHSGKYKGREIKGFDINGTRPTQDRIKKSMFDMIQNNIKNSICLDLFSGSGQLGIECISNEAHFCYFVDKSKEAINIINDNLKRLKIENCKVLKMDYLSALNTFKNNNISFDIIILDPPYKDTIIDNIIKFIDYNNLLNKDGIIVVEYEHINMVNNYNNIELIKEKKYGYKNVRIYKNNY